MIAGVALVAIAMAEPNTCNTIKTMVAAEIFLLVARRTCMAPNYRVFGCWAVFAMSQAGILVP